MVIYEIKQYGWVTNRWCWHCNPKEDDPRSIFFSCYDCTALINKSDSTEIPNNFRHKEYMK
jgi:hypothetical protein